MKILRPAESRNFIIAELAPERYFTVQGHKHTRWSPEVGTPNIRCALMWPPFASPRKVLNDIERLCIISGKKMPRISQIVSCEAIIVRPIYKRNECPSPSPEPSSSDSTADQIESLSTRISLLESTLLKERKISASASAKAWRKPTSKGTSRKSRTK